MFRLYIPIALFVLFVGYILYMLIVKKDKKQLKDFLYPGVLFIGSWVLLYWWLS